MVLAIKIISILASLIGAFLISDLVKVKRVPIKVRVDSDRRVR